MTLPAPTPDLWLRQLFSAQAARDGGVVRRSVRDVERILGRGGSSGNCVAGVTALRKTPGNS